MFLVDATSLQRSDLGRIYGSTDYDADNPDLGRYALVPDYIGSIPTCPAGGHESYVSAKETPDIGQLIVARCGRPNIHNEVTGVKGCNCVMFLEVTGSSIGTHYCCLDWETEGGFVNISNNATCDMAK
ncbi:MAG: hypothetical protein ACLFQV_10940 [Vulcanimicrobiota bacterium]